MKNIILIISFVLVYVISCQCQPNTKTTLQAGIVNAVEGKTYSLFIELKTDTSTSRLVDGMDYLDPDVSDLQVALTNPVVSGDTTFYEYEFPDKTFEQFAKGGLVQTDNITQKYSAMTTSYWIPIDKLEAMQAGFIFRRKN